MSVTNLTIKENEIFSFIKEHYESTKQPVHFGRKAISLLIEMQKTTVTLFNYTWCQDYVDTLIQSLRGCLFLDYVDREEQADNLDRMKLPETVTINRDEASRVFFLIQLVVKYLGDMNHFNELFEKETSGSNHH